MTRASRRVVRDLIAVAAISSVVFLLAYLIIGNTDSRPRRVKPGAITERIREIAEAGVRGNSLIVEDPFVAAQVEQILSAISGTMQYSRKVTVLIVRSPMVNAAALPGGLIVVYAGLIRKLDSADEFAAVLAHELGHVANRDPLRQILRSLGLSAIAVLVGGNQAEILIERLTREAITLTYAKKYESRADDFALDAIEEAGLDPGLFAQALRNLAEPDEGVRSAVVRYLDPHDTIEERVAKSLRRSSGSGYASLGIDWRTFKSRVSRSQPE